MLAFDFYIPSKNILVEYDGLQHFKSGCFVNRQHTTTTADLRGIRERDRIKTDYAKRRDIRLLRIAYTEFSRIDEILMTTFNQIGVDFL
jgi:very-short-patch-repair endonuclease